jgi:hypothetical protein
LNALHVIGVDGFRGAQFITSIPTPVLTNGPDPIMVYRPYMSLKHLTFAPQILPSSLEELTRPLTDQLWRARLPNTF